MAKTTFKTYEGTFNWAKVYEDNRDMGPEDDSDVGKKITEEQGRYSVDFIVDEDTKAQMIKDGIPESILGYDQFKPYEDDDSLWVYRAKRPHFKPTMVDRDTGELGVVFGPPNVVDYNASLEAKETIHITDLIGNGSKGLLKVSIYKGRATIVTLQGIAIKELVEYTPDTDEVRF